MELPRPGDHGRHLGGASRRRARQAGLGAAAVLARLALAARARGQPLVSDRAAVPAAAPGDWDSVLDRVRQELMDKVKEMAGFKARHAARPRKATGGAFDPAGVGVASAGAIGRGGAHLRIRAAVRSPAIRCAASLRRAQASARPIGRSPAPGRGRPEGRSQIRARAVELRRDPQRAQAARGSVGAASSRRSRSMPGMSARSTTEAPPSRRWAATRRRLPASTRCCPARETTSTRCRIAASVAGARAQRRGAREL